MARTAVTPIRIKAAGVSPMSAIAADSVNGNVVPNTPGLYITFTNTDTSAHTVTIISTAKVGDLEVADLTITLDPSASRICGGFSTAAFGRMVNFTTDSNLVTFTAYTV